MARSDRHPGEPRAGAPRQSPAHPDRALGQDFRSAFDRPGAAETRFRELRRL